MIKVPFNVAKFKQIAANCTAEYVNYMPRGKTVCAAGRLKRKSRTETI